MLALLDSIRKDVDYAAAERHKAHMEYLAARRVFRAADKKLKNLRKAEATLESELEKTL